MIYTLNLVIFKLNTKKLTLSSNWSKDKLGFLACTVYPAQFILYFFEELFNILLDVFADWDMLRYGSIPEEVGIG